MEASAWTVITKNLLLWLELGSSQQRIDGVCGHSPRCRPGVVVVMVSFGFLRAIYCPVCTYSRKTKVCPSMLLFTAVRSLLMFYVEYFAVISAMFSAKLALPAECKAGWELGFHPV